jgi:hypothetical protein
MSPGTPPLLNPEIRAKPSGRRGLARMSVVSFTGDQTTAGYTSRSSTYPMPVVRELPPRQPSFEATW